MTAPEPRVPVIDMWAPFVPSAEVIDDLREGFPVELLSYFEVFTKTTISAEQFGAYAESLRRTDDQILDSLDDAGITRSLITGFDERSTCGVTFVHNASVAAVAARYPDRFLPFAGADILAGDSAVDEFERWVVEHGFRGLSLRPFMIGRPASDPAYFPCYAKCVELGVPVSIHTSADWTRTRLSDLGHPRHIDDVACRFPELTILMSHGGYPWVLQACLIAWKHPNVYLELGRAPSQVLRFTGRWMGAADAVWADNNPQQDRLRYRRISHQPPLPAIVRRDACAAGPPGSPGGLAMA